MPTGFDHYEVLCHYYESGGHGVPLHYGVTNGTHKLIRYPEKHLKTWELFDIQEDPQEMSNVYGSKDYAKIQRKLKAELDRLREKFKVDE